MKAILLALCIIFSASVFADGRDRHPIPNRHSGGGHWIAPMIGGAIIGGLLVRQYYPPVYYAPYYPPVIPYYPPPQPIYYCDAYKMYYMWNGAECPSGWRQIN